MAAAGAEDYLSDCCSCSRAVALRHTLSTSSAAATGESGQRSDAFSAVVLAPLRPCRARRTAKRPNSNPTQSTRTRTDCSSCSNGQEPAGRQWRSFSSAYRAECDGTIALYTPQQRPRRRWRPHMQRWRTRRAKRNTRRATYVQGAGMRSAEEGGPHLDEPFHHSHSVGRERAGLVRTDGRRVAHSLAPNVR